MKTVLLLALFITGCTHTNTVHVVDTTVTDALKQDVARLSYMIANDFCFATYGVCLGKGERKDCFETHEKCVVNVYNTWKDLIK